MNMRKNHPARRPLTWIACASFSTYLLTGCSSPPVKSFFATKLDANVVVAANTNPDPSGRASPIVVRVYELKAAQAFQSADFPTLFDKEANVLGNDLVARDEYEFAPGAKTHIVRNPNPETRFIGVIAAYRSIADAKWRALYQVVESKTNEINIVVEQQAVLINQSN